MALWKDAMALWKDCVVSLIDFIGVKKMAEGRKKRASRIMRKMHAEAVAQMHGGLPLHAHAYIWNDSILLLAFLDQVHRPEPIMREVDGLKRKLAHLGKSYAISIKGQVFPDLAASISNECSGRATVIKASSFAMANCFRVEECIAKKRMKPWYVDSRLALKIRTSQACTTVPVKLLPGPKTREVYVYDGYLWEI